MGLSGALHVIHDFFLFKTPSDQAFNNCGIHGDLKPENILYFSNWEGVNNEFGILQIADFGTARYHSDVSVNHVSPHIRRWHPYCSPEVELPWHIDQSVDVWALGCLFLDFVVWFLYDHKGIAEFKESRKLPSLAGNVAGYHFYDLDQRLGRFSMFNPTATLSLAAGVKEARFLFSLLPIPSCFHFQSTNFVLAQWTIKLQNHPAASKFIQDMLKFIPTHMLVLEDRSQAINPIPSSSEAATPASYSSLVNQSGEQGQVNGLSSSSPPFSTMPSPCVPNHGQKNICPQEVLPDIQGFDGRKEESRHPNGIHRHFLHHNGLLSLVGGQRQGRGGTASSKWRRLKSMDLHLKLGELCLDGKPENDKYYSEPCAPEDIPALRQTLRMSHTKVQLSAMSRYVFGRSRGNLIRSLP